MYIIMREIEKGKGSTLTTRKGHGLGCSGALDLQGAAMVGSGLG